MPLVANGNYLYNGKGAVLLKRLQAAGTAAGFKLVGSVTKLAIQMGSTAHDERSPMEAGAPVTRRFNVDTTPEIQMTIKEFDADVLAMALLGERVSYTQPATAITNEAHADVKQGHLIRLAKLGPVTVQAVTGSGGTPAYNSPADWTLEDGAPAFIKITEGGGIADGTDIEVDYTPTAYTNLKQVRGATKTIIECALCFRPDPTSGPKEVLDVWKIGLSSDALLDLIHHGTAEPGSFDLKGIVLSDAANHASSPYFEVTELGTV